MPAVTAFKLTVCRRARIFVCLILEKPVDGPRRIIFADTSWGSEMAEDERLVFCLTSWYEFAEVATLHMTVGEIIIIQDILLRQRLTAHFQHLFDKVSRQLINTT